MFIYQVRTWAKSDKSLVKLVGNPRVVGITQKGDDIALLAVKPLSKGFRLKPKPTTKEAVETMLYNDPNFMDRSTFLEDMSLYVTLPKQLK